MALDTQHYELKLNAGLDQSTDAAANESGFEVLDNFEYNRDGGLSKRRGFVQLGTSAAVNNGGRGTLVHGEVSSAIADQYAIAGIDSSGVLPATQNFYHAHLERAAYLASGGNVVWTDGAALEIDGDTDVFCLVSQDAVGILSIGMFDRVTGTTRARHSFSGMDTNFPCHVIALASQQRFMVFAQNLGTNRTDAYTVTPAGVVTTHANFSGSSDAITGFDITTDPLDASQGWFIWTTAAAAGTMKIRTFTDTALGSFSLSITGVPVTANHVHIVVDDGAVPRVHWLIHRSDTNHIWFYSRQTNNTNTLSTDTGLGASATVLSHGLCALRDPVANKHLVVCVAHESSFTLSDPDAKAYLIWGSMAVDHSGSFTVETLRRLLVPLTRPFTITTTSTSKPAPRAAIVVSRNFDFLTATDSSVAQRPAMLVTLPLIGTVGSDGHGLNGFNHVVEPIATVLADSAAVVPGYAHGPVGAGPSWYLPLKTVATNAPVPAIFWDAPFTFDAIAMRLVVGNAEVEDFSATPRYSALPVATAGGSYVGGSMLRFWDGQVCGEAVPLLPPIIKVETVLSGNHGINGTYSWCAVAEWADANGLLHRSAPSRPVSATQAGNTTYFKVTAYYSVPTMLDTDVEQTWRIKIFRTEAGGATFFAETLQPIYQGGDVVLLDGNGAGGTTNMLLDTQLDGLEVLYTDGGVLSNEPPAATSVLLAHANRLWGVDAQDPARVYFSKEREEGIAYEFNAALAVRLDGSSGPVRALGSLDDKLILFTDTDTYAVSGVGPNALGQGAYAPPELVARGVGCRSPAGAVSTPVGVLFLSSTGFRLLGRDLSVTDVGKSVLDLMDGAFHVGASCHFPDVQQVWFLSADPARATYALVFDYRRGQQRWSTVTPSFGSPTAALYDVGRILGQPSLVASSNGGADGTLGVVTQLDVTHTGANPTWVDNLNGVGVFVPARVGTQWLRPDGVLGDLRVRTVHWTARDGDDVCNITVSVFRQFPAVDETDGEDRTWNAGVLATAGTDPLHGRMRLAAQRAQAVQIAVSYGTPTNYDFSTLNAQGPILNAIGIEFGVRQRATKPGTAMGPSS